MGRWENIRRPEAEANSCNFNQSLRVKTLDTQTL
jgi:hypothetical protein